MTGNNQAKLLDGKKLAKKIKLDLTKKIGSTKRRPGLSAILVGDNKASSMYVNLKEEAAQEVGVDFHKYLCNKECYGEVNQDELIGLIKFLNKDDNINGILLQLPLPKKYDSQKVIDTIDKSKDVDGFFSAGEKDKVIPPTICAIVELLKSTNENLEGKKALVVAKSDIYTKKMVKYLKDLKLGDVKASAKIPKNSDQYDIIIIALGQAGALKKEMVKEDAIVIDVGINKVDGKTVGDVDSSVMKKASYVSPVPGGVGPLTVACLLRNTYILFEKK